MMWYPHQHRPRHSRHPQIGSSRRRKLSRKHAGCPQFSPSVFPLGFLWFANSNLNTQTIANSNNPSSLSQSFSYDTVNRLISAGETGASSNEWSQSYCYDQFGNRSLISGGFVPYPGVTPQVTSCGPANSFTNNQFTAANYDTAGNILTDSSLSSASTASYDAENRQQTVTGLGMGTLQYYYDGNGSRVMKVICSSTPCTSTTSGAQVTTYVYDASGQLAAEYGSAPPVSGTQYLFTDHLGSTRILANSSGAFTRCYDFAPFGEPLASTGSRASCYNDVPLPSGTPGALSLQFTSKERDSETGLDFFGARYMSSAQGRFTSPDRPLADQNPFDPQSWNLYTYGRNNPLINTDPTGRTCVTLTNADGSTFQGDDSDGQGCGKAQVAPTNGQKPSDTNASDVTPSETNVNAQQGSLLGLLLAPAVPRYVANDRPLGPKGQAVTQELSKRIDQYPTVCGGGVYAYVGREFGGGGVNGFTGGIVEIDSQHGISSGSLGELGAGEGVVGGVGGTVTQRGNGPVSSEGLVYAGIGAHSPLVSTSGGVVAFGNGPSSVTGVGLYGEAFLGQGGGGAGVYVNLSSIGRGCGK
jgi:RHS repeat-associated protein